MAFSGACRAARGAAGRLAGRLTCADGVASHATTTGEHRQHRRETTPAIPARAHASVCVA
jgi:hypothetical protein